MYKSFTAASDCHCFTRNSVKYDDECVLKRRSCRVVSNHQKLLAYGVVSRTMRRSTRVAHNSSSIFPFFSHS